MATAPVNMTIYFKILTIKLHILNTHVKFRYNRMFFTIQSIYLFFMQNFILQNLIDDS